ncbi:hypothetical protein PMG11_03198 [Penicillium brasilianum]|uniref:Rhodopsin domain-containing protein n=1 Tax=Penicillium brasilianum TaxID=104259 RepID=A0A0F7VEW6_PENBI|nr:hypothetical protein PMG11_03198 [Penicillium brasilianum]
MESGLDLMAFSTRYTRETKRADIRESAHWSRTLISIAVTFVAMATISFLLRLWSRQKTKWKLALEDVLMGVGLVFSYLLSACVIIAACNGVGYNIWALPRQTQGRVGLVFWLGQKFWVLSHVFVKLSIILLIRRLLYIAGNWQKVTSGLILFTIAWGITTIVGNALQCLPPRYFWERNIDGHCPDNQEAFAITMGSMALAEDVFLLVIPIMVVWQLKLSLHLRYPARHRVNSLSGGKFDGQRCFRGYLGGY